MSMEIKSRGRTGAKLVQFTHRGRCVQFHRGGIGWALALVGRRWRRICIGRATAREARFYLELLQAAAEHGVAVPPIVTSWIASLPPQTQQVMREGGLV